MNGPAGWTLARLRDVSLRQALANVVPGEGMAKRICARGAPRHRVHVIHNWVGDEQIRPVPVAENPLRRAWELQDKFVVAYSGNLGRAHDFDTVLRAAKLVRHRTQILFLFIGGGHSFDQLKRAVKQQNLCGTFTFVPYQPADVLKYSLGVADVHLISLKAALEGLVVPSKFYGIAAAGKPVIAIAAADGEIARLVRAYSCGLIIEPGNGDTLAERLVQLSQDPVRVADMGRRARAMLEDRFTRKQALARWQLLLSELQDTSRAVIDRSDSE
jgi:glycosyltransferase involved in cell wall biosynthesis